MLLNLSLSSMETHHQPKWHEINQAMCGFTEISLCLAFLTTIFKWQKLTVCRSCHLHIVQNKSLKGDGKILLDKTFHEDDSYQKLWRETREILEYMFPEVLRIKRKKAELSQFYMISVGSERDDPLKSLLALWFSFFLFF